MRTIYDVLEEEGLLGRELTPQEIADDELEALIDFDDPAYLMGQLASVLADCMEEVK